MEEEIEVLRSFLVWCKNNGSVAFTLYREETDDYINRIITQYNIDVEKYEST